MLQKQNKTEKNKMKDIAMCMGVECRASQADIELLIDDMTLRKKLTNGKNKKKHKIPYWLKE